MAAGGEGERPFAFKVETLAVAAARPQLVALDFPASAEWLVIGPICLCGAFTSRCFWVAYLHVRQPYLERAEDLFERAGPPVEFGVPRSFSGLGDMIAAASLQSSRRRRGLDGSR